MVTGDTSGHIVYTFVYTFQHTSFHFNSEVVFCSCPAQKPKSVIIQLINPHNVCNEVTKFKNSKQKSVAANILKEILVRLRRRTKLDMPVNFTGARWRRGPPHCKPRVVSCVRHVARTLAIVLRLHTAQSLGLYLGGCLISVPAVSFSMSSVATARTCSRKGPVCTFASVSVFTVVLCAFHGHGIDVLHHMPMELFALTSPLASQMSKASAHR